MGFNLYNYHATNHQVVAHAFDNNTQEAELGRSEFKVVLVYKVRYRTARSTEKSCLRQSQAHPPEDD